MGGKWNKTKKSEFLAYCLCCFVIFQRCDAEQFQCLLQKCLALKVPAVFYCTHRVIYEKQVKRGVFFWEMQCQFNTIWCRFWFCNIFHTQNMTFFCDIGKFHNCESRPFQNHTIIISSFLGFSNLILFEIYILSRSKRYIKFALFIALDHT